MSCYEDFVKWSVEELQNYLRARGQQTSGGKQVLVARAFCSWERGDPVVPVSRTEVENQLATEYQSVLSKYSVEDPLLFDTKEWTLDLTKWPKLDLGKICKFVLDNKEYDTNYIGVYKTKKAYSYYTSGFVGPIKSCQKNDVTYITCHVTPSQRVRDEARQLWIAFHPDGNVITAWCACTAGHSKTCNHVLAALYKIDVANTNMYVEPTATSVACKWNEVTKANIEPGFISSIRFSKDDRFKVVGEVQVGHTSNVASDARSDFIPEIESDRVPSEDETAELFERLKVCVPKSVVIPLYMADRTHASDTPIEIPLPLPEMADSYIDNAPLSKRLEKNILISDFLESCCYTDEQVASLERQTRGQNLNDTWLAQRKGRLTASNHHRVHRKMIDIIQKGKSKVTQMASEILGNTADISNIPAIKWGNDHEKDAAKSFAESITLQHVGYHLYECGLFVDKNNIFLGASPDRMSKCSCCGECTVEIKCPYSVRNAAIDQDHLPDFLHSVDGNIVLKTSHRYYTQVQSQMAITNTKKCFFVVWTTKSVHHEIIPFDSKYWSEVKNNLTMFFKTYVLPYLLGFQRFYFCPTCCKLCLPEEEISAPPEQSIGCDSCNLWYHWQCQNVKSPPPEEQDWLCSTCQTEADNPTKQPLCAGGDGDSEVESDSDND